MLFARNGNMEHNYWKWFYLMFAFLVCFSVAQAGYYYEFKSNAETILCEGNWDVATWTCANTYDDNYGTHGQADVGNVTYVYFNYTKQANMNSEGTLWRFKDGVGSNNMSVPEDCFDEYSNVIAFRVMSDEPNNKVVWYCDSGSWQTVRVGAGTIDIFEDGLWINTTEVAPVTSTPYATHDDNTTPYYFAHSETVGVWGYATDLDENDVNFTYNIYSDGALMLSGNNTDSLSSGTVHRIYDLTLNSSFLGKLLKVGVFAYEPLFTSYEKNSTTYNVYFGYSSKDDIVEDLEGVEEDTFAIIKDSNNITFSNLSLGGLTQDFEVDEEADSNLSSGTWTDVGNVNDGDWSTFGRSTTDYAFVYLNYTKPDNAVWYGTKWEYKDNNGRNLLDIESTCWNANESQLELRIESYEGVIDNTAWECWNGTEWYVLRDASTSSRVYEERIKWNTGWYDVIIQNSTDVTYDNFDVTSLKPDNLVLDIDFTHRDGTTVYDSSGNGNDGEVLYDTSFVEGVKGYAVYFDGDLDQIEIPDSVSLQSLDDEMTVSFWINPDNMAGLPDGVPIDQYKLSINSGWYVEWETDWDGKIVLEYAVGNGTETVFTMTNTTFNGDYGRWIHYVATRTNNGDGTWTHKVYVDGVLDNEKVTDVDLGHYNYDMLLGANAPTAEFFKGYADEYKVWNDDLTEDEVKKLYGYEYDVIVKNSSLNSIIDSGKRYYIDPSNITDSVFSDCEMVFDSGNMLYNNSFEDCVIWFEGTGNNLTSNNFTDCVFNNMTGSTVTTLLDNIFVSPVFDVNPLNVTNITFWNEDNETDIGYGLNDIFVWVNATSEFGNLNDYVFWYENSVDNIENDTGSQVKSVFSLIGNLSNDLLTNDYEYSAGVYVCDENNTGLCSDTYYSEVNVTVLDLMNITFSSVTNATLFWLDNTHEFGEVSNITEAVYNLIGNYTGKVILTFGNGTSQSQVYEMYYEDGNVVESLWVLDETDTGNIQNQKYRLISSGSYVEDGEVTVYIQNGTEWWKYGQGVSNQKGEATTKVVAGKVTKAIGLKTNYLSGSWLGLIDDGNTETYAINIYPSIQVGYGWTLSSSCARMLMKDTNCSFVLHGYSPVNQICYEYLYGGYVFGHDGSLCVNPSEDVILTIELTNDTLPFWIAMRTQSGVYYGNYTIEMSDRSINIEFDKDQGTYSGLLDRLREHPVLLTTVYFLLLILSVIITVMVQDMIPQYSIHILGASFIVWGLGGFWLFFIPAFMLVIYLVGRVFVEVMR